jgi:hypothetical protein
MLEAAMLFECAPGSRDPPAMLPDVASFRFVVSTVVVRSTAGHPERGVYTQLAPSIHTILIPRWALGPSEKWTIRMPEIPRSVSARPHSSTHQSSSLAFRAGSHVAQTLGLFDSRSRRNADHT